MRLSVADDEVLQDESNSIKAQRDLMYQFIKRLPKVEKTIFIGVSFAIAYLLVSIIYWISGVGIDKQINEAAKDFIIYTFVPVNIILLVPFIASKYNKLRGI